MTTKQQAALQVFANKLRLAMIELAETTPLPDTTSWVGGRWESERADEEERCQFVEIVVRVGDCKRVYTLDLSLL